MEMCEKTDPEMLRYWVWLALIFGAASSRLLYYVQNADSPRDIYDAMQAGRYRDLSPVQQKAMTEHSLGEADSIAYYCRSHDIALLTIDSQEYPSALRHIAAPPVLLTAQGNLSLLDQPMSLAVVGTRRPSPYTERVTKTIVGELSRRGVVIVSGFAKGVDGFAHTAALDNGGATVAVLGCGINVNYPREHQVLRERMLSSGKGLLVSEYLPGTQPFPANFPRRNRILSGLCPATAVMEAAERSGSLSTAQFACDQGRMLYCVPPADIFDPRYHGVVSLLRDGACPLMSYEDVLMSFYSRYPQYVLRMLNDDFSEADQEFFSDVENAVQQENHSAEMMTQHSAPKPEKTKKPVKPEQPVPQPDDKPLPESETGRQIVQYLRECGDTYADDIAAALDIDLSTLLSELTLLELDGFVETLFGKHFRAI